MESKADDYSLTGSPVGSGAEKYYGVNNVTEVKSSGHFGNLLKFRSWADGDKYVNKDGAITVVLQLLQLLQQLDVNLII